MRQSFGFSIIGGDTRYPDELAASLKETLLSIPNMTLMNQSLIELKIKR